MEPDDPEQSWQDTQQTIGTANNRRRHMRKSVLALTGAAAMLAGGAMMSGTAGAVTLGNSDGVRGAVGTISPVEQAGCWRHGWHGWGWYPSCHRFHPGYGYGYDRDWWGGGWRHHRWHRWRSWDY
jgi:hypothetical protein